MKKDGTAENPRWGWGVDHSGWFSWLWHPFESPEHYYRVIAIAVSPEPILTPEPGPTEERIQHLCSEGASVISPALRGQRVGVCRCEALIYEFKRANHDAPVEWVRSSELTALAHLVGAGILKRRE